MSEEKKLLMLLKVEYLQCIEWWKNQILIEKNRPLHHQKKEHEPKHNTQTKVSDITISTCASKSR